MVDADKIVIPFPWLKRKDKLSRMGEHQKERCRKISETQPHAGGVT